MTSPSPLAAARRDALTLRGNGDLRAARELLERAVAAARPAYGDDHPDVLSTLHALARLHREAGDPAGARRVLEAALAAGERRNAAEPVLLGIAFDLGTMAEMRGDVDEASRHFARVAQYGPQALGPDHWAVRAATDYLDGGDSEITRPITSFTPRPGPVPRLEEPPVPRPRSLADLPEGAALRPDRTPSAPTSGPPAAWTPSRPTSGPPATWTPDRPTSGPPAAWTSDRPTTDPSAPWGSSGPTSAPPGPGTDFGSWTDGRPTSAPPGPWASVGPTSGPPGPWAAAAVPTSGASGSVPTSGASGSVPTSGPTGSVPTDAAATPPDPWADPGHWTGIGRYADPDRWADLRGDADPGRDTGPSRHTEPDRYADPDRWADLRGDAEPDRPAGPSRYTDPGRRTAADPGPWAAADPTSPTPALVPAPRTASNAAAADEPGAWSEYRPATDERPARSRAGTTARVVAAVLAGVAATAAVAWFLATGELPSLP